MKNKIKYETPIVISENIFDVSAGGISLFIQCRDHGLSWDGKVNHDSGSCKNKAYV